MDGVDSVDVDLDARTVVVHGSELDDAELRTAIAGAGYRLPRQSMSLERTKE